MFWRSILWVLALSGALAFAQDSDQEAQPDSEATQPASEQSSEAVSDEEFIPTKEVPADEEITFPVNI